jgi:hypothetical protein
VRSTLIGIGVVVAAAIAAMAAASASWIFWEAWHGSDREAFRALVGAFAGAFFAFLFLRFGEAGKRVFERKEKNYNTLVRLQHYVNDCLNITGDNIFVIDDFFRCFSDERLRKGELSIFINRFQQYPIDRELVIGLTNLEFANDLYTLNVELSKMNDSLATLGRSYEQVMDAFISKKIDNATYLLNVRTSRDRYREIREFLVQTKEDLIKAFATTNLLVKDAPFLVQVTRILVRSKYGRRFPEDLKFETTKVRGDIERGAEKSRHRISEVQGRAIQQTAEPRRSADDRRSAG